MGKFARWGNDLHSGQRGIDFVGRRWLLYGISLVFIAIALAGIGGKGLNLGIEFTGGTQYRIPIEAATQADADELRNAVADTGIEAASSPVASTVGPDAVQVQVETLTQEESDQITAVITDLTGVSPDDLSQDDIGASWGSQIAQRALVGLAVFLVLVVLFIGLYFKQWKMSIAALVALAHDVIITVGVYALTGFEVTPATVTGILTILAFSLYDTVVVFDKVKENTAEMKKRHQTYAQAANLAVNQTLVRSINTSVVALLPIGSILYVGAVQLGASSLQDLALSLFVGMAAGTYSSVCIATPLLVHMKKNESEVVLAERRAKARARAAVDPYASVPSKVDDEGNVAGAGAAGAATLVADDEDDAAYDDEPGSGASTQRTRRPSQAEASTPDEAGKGRIAPPAHGPMRDGGAGRQQPSRQPRSKRGKK